MVGYRWGVYMISVYGLVYGSFTHFGTGMYVFGASNYLSNK